MKAVLELHLTCPEGKEVECAQHVVQQLEGCHLAILTALAAEILTEQERRQAGSAVVVVAGAPAAERVLADLRKAQ